jgi:hypothetical protein
MRRATFALALLATGMFALSAQAEIKHFHANLDAASEVPPTQSKGHGKLEATLDTATRTLSYTLTFSGLTGPAAAAHFHGPAAPGENAGVAVPIKGLTSPSKGTAKLTDAQMAELEAGKWYVNVHTAKNPAGEIRGQVLPGT